MIGILHGMMPDGDLIRCGLTVERRDGLTKETLEKEVIGGREVCVRIGVDLGGHDIKFGVTNLSAERILLPELVKRPSLTHEGPARTVDQTIDGISEVLARLGLGWADVADVAVTVPCPCSAEGVIIEATNIGTPETKKLWQVPFGDLLAKAAQKTGKVAVPVFACNDANAAGQDDDFARFGWTPGHRTSVFITTGTGLGGCVLIDGRVFFGRGQAGELGHVKPAIPQRFQARFAQDLPPRCGCGAVQCAETRASLSGLVHRIGWALSQEGLAFIEAGLEERGEKLAVEVVERLSELSRKEGNRRAAYEVRSFADRDADPFCRWLLEDWAIVIGALFASVAPVLHPDLFIIGGGLTEMSAPTRDWFISVTRRVFEEINGQSCFDTAPGNCELVWSVSRDQGWRGAILMDMRARGQ